MSVNQRDFNVDVVVAQAPPQAAGRITLPLSGPMKVDLMLYRGDTGRFKITISDSSGNPMDVTTATWDADIRVKANDPTQITSFDITLALPEINVIDVLLDATKSALVDQSCVYDIEMTLDGVVTTLIYGAIAVTQDVSRT